MNSPKRIAVIGAGVAGLSAAYALKDAAELVIYEKEGRLGGHAHTVVVDYDGRPVSVDTGFIVFNAVNYPNLCALFAALGVESFETDMSFGFSTPGGVEWCSSLLGFFAQKRNALSPRFLGMLSDILRFNTQAPADLRAGRAEGVALGDYLDQRGFGEAFRRLYLLPMGAAIWSTTERSFLGHPAAAVIRFFENHRLTEVKRNRWRTVRGGSKAYVDALATALGPRVALRRGAAGVLRRPDGVLVRDERGRVERFDEVVLACHSDQALALLEDPSPEEDALLGAIRFSRNRVVLHRDQSAMPQRRAAWAAWNYQLPPGGEAAQVTYDMNRLQAISSETPLYVTLNPVAEPDPALTFASYRYDHPQFDSAALAAQRIFNSIQGVRRTWFAGAWLGYGFHEDGCRAGLRVGLKLGGRIPWAFAEGDVSGGPWGAARETPADARAAVS